MTTTLAPNRDQLEIFIDAMFRHAGQGGYVSLRSFLPDNKLLKPIRTVVLNGSGSFAALVNTAEELALHAANYPEPAVFCPPIAVFQSSEGKAWQAREQDLLKGLVLSVECDERPQEACWKLEEILGPATAIVRSGGVWTDPEDGQPHDKLHIHWRLQKPAMGEALAVLKEARRLATAIAGADPSNIPAVHCLRWPGSWHRKGTPRLCDMFATFPDAEIDLDTAVAALRAAAPKIQPKLEPIPTGDPAEWSTLIGDIIAGRNLHGSITRLAAKYVHCMSPGAAVNQLRGLMDISAARRERPDDWKSRYDDIPRAVETANQKYPPEPEIIDLGEWDAGDDPGFIDPRPWLLGTYFCRGFVSSLFAAGGIGKTTVRLLQYISMALGRSLCGQHVFQRCRVLLLTLEDNDAELQRRIAAVLLHYRIDRGELRGWLFCKAVRRQKLAMMEGRERQAGPLEKTLRAAIERRKPDLVSLDPFVKTHSLVENDSGDMDFVADVMVTLAIEYNIAVDSPHHVHKGTITPGDADSGRGASGIRDAARLAYTLCVMSEDEAKNFSISPDDRFSYVRMDSAKVNIAVNKRAEWFHLVGVRLGNAAGVYLNGDTVQVAEPWQPPETWAGLATKVLNAILDDIAAGPCDENGTPSGERYSNAPAARERAAWPVAQRFAPDKAEKQCREIIRVWIKNGVLTEANYKSPGRDGREVLGLFVEDGKRPGTRTG
jgi:hypothetical protein